MRKFIWMVLLANLSCNLIYSKVEEFSGSTISFLAPESMLQEDDDRGYDPTRYDASYAARYFQTIVNSYTRYKNGLVAIEILNFLFVHGSPVRILDVGTNINTISASGLLGGMVDLGFREFIDFKGIDLSPYYFDWELQSLLHPEQLLSHDQIGKGIVGDIRDYPFQPNSFEVVTVLDVFEHVPDIEGILNKIRAILTDDGRLIVIVPTFYKLDTLNYPHIRAKRTTSHIHFFGAEEDMMFRMLAEAGFEVSSSFGISYATAFPYLLWTDEGFVPSSDESQPDLERIYKKIIKILERHLSEADFQIIDEKINNEVQNLLDNPFFSILTLVDQDPRNLLLIMAEVLKLHPDFATDPNIQNAYDDISRMVKGIIMIFNNEAAIERLRTLALKFQDPDFFRHYGGNSLYISAIKKVDHTIPANPTQSLNVAA